MSITLDGIAKGYIVDAGVKILRGHGFENVLVEAGGDLLASGYKAAEVPWKIGIQSPRKGRSGLMQILSVKNQGVATSGDYMQSYSPDFANHHIIDPRCGRSPREIASVTVIAPTATLADGLSTTLMVLGPEAGTRLMKHFPDCEAYLIGKDLKMIVT
jgi:thiamine biosynthesis lipoprotein